MPTDRAAGMARRRRTKGRQQPRRAKIRMLAQKSFWGQLKDQKSEFEVGQRRREGRDRQERAKESRPRQKSQLTSLKLLSPRWARHRSPKP